MKALFLSAILFAVLARGATNSLSLADARRLAFARNWDLLAAQSDVDAATAQQRVAAEFPNPSIAAGSTKLDLAGNRGAGTDNGLWDRSYDTVAAVSQLIEIGGKRTYRRASADAGHAAARARFDAARRLLDAGVARTYIAAALAEANANVLRESSAFLRQEAEIAAVRFRAGDISSSDLDHIELAAAQDELGTAGADAAATQQRIALESLLGERSPRGDLRLANTVEQLAAAEADGTNVVFASRPDLAAVEAAQLQAEAEFRLQRAQRVPDPTVSVQYEHNPPDGDNTVGFGISFPLPLWNRNEGAIQAAEVARRAAAREVEHVRAQIVSDIAVTRAVVAEATARWRSYRDALRPQAEKIRRTVSLAYEKGGATLLDLLEAQRNDNAVRLAAAQAAADCATATAAWMAAINRPAPELPSRSNQP